MSFRVASASSVRTEADVRELLSGGSFVASDLVSLLDEQHHVYNGIDTFAVNRIRGALLLAFADTSVAMDGLPFVLEELESPHDAYLTAAAAHTLRGIAAPNAIFVEPLLRAVFYIRHRDDRVRLGSYGGYGSEGETTTAMAEVLRTIGWLGSAGVSALPRLAALRSESPGPKTTAAIDQALACIEHDLESAEASSPCCASTPSMAPANAAPACRDLRGVEFQDQSGQHLVFEDFFVGVPTIVVFFYSRCENPTKCALTISKLGRLQRELVAQGLEDVISTAAITYDPAYDLPARLQQFGRSWGAEIGPNHRFLRTTGDFSIVREFFQLGVSYGPTVVNRHRLEAFVLDPSGQIAAASTRRQWSERELIDQALVLVTQATNDGDGCCGSHVTDARKQ